MKTKNNKAPNEPCRDPNNVSLNELYMSFIFTFCFLFVRQPYTSFKATSSKPYTSSLAIKSS